MAGRKPKPPAINLEAFRANYREKPHLRGYLHLMERLAAIEDAEHKKELSPAVAALHQLWMLSVAEQSGAVDRDFWNDRARIGFFGPTIEIPEGWLAPILDAWTAYTTEDDRPSLAAAIGTAKGDGRGDARTTIENLTWYFMLATRLQEERIMAIAKNEIISMEEARSRVLHRLEGEALNLSDRTLMRAWDRWGDLIEQLTAVESGRPNFSPR